MHFRVSMLALARDMHLEHGGDAPHVHEAGAEVLADREEEGDQRHSEAEGEQQELDQERGCNIHSL